MVLPAHPAPPHRRIAQIQKTAEGAIGYTVAVEWAFYLFFALGLLHIVSVIIAEQMRRRKGASAAQRVDFWSRVTFIASIAGLFVVAFFVLRT